MRAMQHIPVDRKAGTAAFEAAGFSTAMFSSLDDPRGTVRRESPELVILTGAVHEPHALQLAALARDADALLLPIALLLNGLVEIKSVISWPTSMRFDATTGRPFETAIARQLIHHSRCPRPRSPPGPAARRDTGRRCRVGVVAGRRVVLLLHARAGAGARGGTRGVAARMRTSVTAGRSARLAARAQGACAEGGRAAAS